MTAEIIDGRKIAAEVRDDLKQRIGRLQSKGINPKLATILVGDDPASISYLKGITRTCGDVGVIAEDVRLPASITQTDLLKRIASLNGDSSVHGILLFLPLPKHLNSLEAESAIAPDKDVDGTNPVSTGRLLLGEDTFYPSTPYGVQELLVRSGNNPEGKHVVIVGRSNIVGKPLTGILIQKGKGANATVTVCHTGTKDLASFTKQADILVAAMGKAKAITADMVGSQTIVIDVGVNFIPDPTTGKNKQVGDVDFDAVKEIARAITPVPGGTGAVTSMMLMANTVKAAEKVTS
jgi:methylenetetrahydrofolate dehydrogenase (NADP+) / methenyltetrahydrofolate cyclohydrolase